MNSKPVQVVEVYKINIKEQKKANDHNSGNKEQLQVPVNI